MQTLGSPASVVAAIREDGDAEVDRIQEAAATDLATLAAEAASVHVAVGDREQRLAEARRMNDERIAKQEWEGRRAVMHQREAWIQHVVAKGQDGWAPSSAEAVAALVREARSRLPGGDCEVTASPRGGCIVRIGDLSFDNSFEARSRRLEPEWRSALSGMYKP